MVFMGFPMIRSAFLTTVCRAFAAAEILQFSYDLAVRAVRAKPVRFVEEGPA
jgi:hypothetical protein